MYKVHSLKTDTKAKTKIIEFFQYFCEITILKKHTGRLKFHMDSTEQEKPHTIHLRKY